MTGDTDDDGNAEKHVTRRGVLGGILKGGVGIGAGLAAGGGGLVALGEAGVVDLDRVMEVKDRAVGPSPPEKTPETTEPETPSSPDDTPWNTETVVFTVDRSDDVAGRDHVEASYRNAAAFWNDHVDAREPFDLTLSFDPEASDPDVRFVEEAIMHCSGEYRSPATGNDSLTPYVCVETLTDAPDDTPIEVDMSLGGGGTKTYELVVTHALGRLVGYDVWSDPVAVMNPKILFGPAHADHPDARSILGTPSRGAMYTDRFVENVERSISEIRTADSEHVAAELSSASRDVRGFVDDHESDMSEWKAEVRDLGFPRYADAYDEAVLNDDIAYLEETTAAMTDLAESHSGAEIVDSDALAAVLERLEAITTWPEMREAFDVQIHRAWTDEVWSEWTGA